MSNNIYNFVEESLSLFLDEDLDKFDNRPLNYRLDKALLWTQMY